MYSLNIFHILCRDGHLKLLQHLLTKLPKDVVQGLLRQQSKDQQLTVRGTVPYLCNYSKPSLASSFLSYRWLLIRDSAGSPILYPRPQNAGHGWTYAPPYSRDVGVS
jgi:hypothetical protein